MPVKVVLSQPMTQSKYHGLIEAATKKDKVFGWCVYLRGRLDNPGGIPEELYFDTVNTENLPRLKEILSEYGEVSECGYEEIPTRFRKDLPEHDIFLPNFQKFDHNEEVEEVIPKLWEVQPGDVIIWCCAQFGGRAMIIRHKEDDFWIVKKID